MSALTIRIVSDEDLTSTDWLLVEVPDGAVAMVRQSAVRRRGLAAEILAAHRMLKRTPVAA